MKNRASILTVIGPGLLVAAAGVGAGDLAGGAFAGSKLRKRNGFFMNAILVGMIIFFIYIRFPVFFR